MSLSGADLFRRIVADLAGAGIAEPARDARHLFAHALEIAPDRVMLALHDPVAPAAIARLEAATEARLRRQPLSQIIGRRSFWGRDFRVTPDVLDPRPETETLVAAALEQPFSHVLDLGTGSGAILITLLAERPGARGVATDLSPAALAVARENAAHLGVDSRVAFHEGSWFTPLPEDLCFDLIVSNPPYISGAEMADLAPEVRDWEPHLALTPGGDGLDAYRAIIAEAGAWLRPGGRILLETGAAQGAAVTALLAAAGFEACAVIQDFDKRDRVATAISRKP